VNSVTLSVVCWRWGPLYSVEYVNRLRSMLDRHLHIPHRLFCVTDDSAGMDYRTLHVPMFTETFPGMTSPSGRRANFRRLQTFSADLENIWGKRVLLLDLDIVITDDVTPLFDRPEPLVAFDQRHEGTNRSRKYNTSMVLMDTGILGQMWTDFKTDPQGVFDAARQQRIGDGNNSDQAIFGLYAAALKPATWTPGDGVVPFYKVKNNDGGGLPQGTRAVLFFGTDKPDHPEIQKKCTWIGGNWR
jgi:hypothetical protein